MFLRYRTRSLLVLTASVALPLAWLAQKRTEWKVEEAAVQAMSPHIGYVERSHYVAPVWLYRAGLRFDFLFRVSLVDFAGYSAPGATWRITDPVSQFDDAAFREVAPQLRRLEHLSQLHVDTTRITDASADIIAQFDQLEFLNIQGDDFSDATARDLMERMPNTKIAFFFSG